MYYDFLQRNKRRIIIGSVLFISILMIWSAIVITGRIGKTATTISVVPSDATITLNGKRVGNGNQWITAGTYELSITKDGFSPDKRSVKISEEKEQNVIVSSLVAKSDEAKKWAEDNQKKYQDNEKYGAIAARVEGAYFAEKNPITTKLPFTDPYYTISYTPTKNGDVDLVITTPSPRYRFYAVEKIREFGFEPTDFTITFKDFKNPLGGKS